MSWPLSRMLQTARAGAVATDTLDAPRPAEATRSPVGSLAIASRHLLSLQENWRRIVSRHTGQPYEKVVKDSDCDNWLSAEQAKEYALLTRSLQMRLLQKALRLRRNLVSSKEKPVGTL